MVSYPGLKRRQGLNYAIKQMIAHEVDLEKMRGEDRGREEISKGPISTKRNERRDVSGASTSKNKAADAADKIHEKETTAEKKAIQETTGEGNKVIQENQTTNNKSVKRTLDEDEDKTVGRDFFGRKIKVDPAKKKDENDKNSEILSSDIWFKFKEGFNNAVRRNVKMKDLLW